MFWSNLDEKLLKAVIDKDRSATAAVTVFKAYVVWLYDPGHAILSEGHAFWQFLEEISPYIPSSFAEDEG